MKLHFQSCRSFTVNNQSDPQQQPASTARQLCAFQEQPYSDSRKTPELQISPSLSLLLSTSLSLSLFSLSFVLAWCRPITPHLRQAAPPSVKVHEIITGCNTPLLPPTAAALPTSQPASRGAKSAARRITAMYTALHCTTRHYTIRHAEDVQHKTAKGRHTEQHHVHS